MTQNGWNSKSLGVAAEKSRYQVHVQLDNPHDLPSNLVWLSVLHE